MFRFPSVVSLVKSISITGVAMCALAGQSLAENQIADGQFEDTIGAWWGTENLELELDNGQLCANVPAGTINPWDAIIGMDGINLVDGEEYEFSFTASGDPEGPVRALVQMPVDPWTSYTGITERVPMAATDYTSGFKSPVTMDNAQIVFQVGGSLTKPWRLCLDNIALNSDVAVAAYAPDTGPSVRVNQVGYLPDGPKIATVVSDAETPLDWQVTDASGAVLASGQSEPKGDDPSAGESVHVIDFTDLSSSGTDLVLRVGTDQSHPFTISADIYADLLSDALGYFYPVRSGIEIRGDLAGEAYARPAGHLSTHDGGDLNKGDLDVGCTSAEDSETIYGEPWTCDYRLDVTGGWYDAGDHGKYVVNGGISVAQLLSAYERAIRLPSAALPAMEDGAMAIPEAGNNIPDILDEVRWELEWMIKMIVPEGQPMAGLVHHKIHDVRWTGLPLFPHLDEQERVLRRPSTAATLNLVATAAQASRLIADHDETYSDKLLSVAEAAWVAANAMPDVFAPAIDSGMGGGPYDDTDLSDEFYWAAAELYLTTGEAAYLDRLKQSQHWDGPVFGDVAFDWGHVAGLARLQLATVGTILDEADLSAIRRSVITAADAYLELQDSQPFGHPYAPAEGRYGWGSNHMIVQNLIVIATAYDLTGEDRYRQAMLEGFDYLLGRNALNISYITGYGTYFAENQHSRWFANQVNPDLPHPPKGSLSGGPNSDIQDPVAQSLFAEQGCAAQKCYIDDIESWATNEITINWNAALVHFASFLMDQ